VGHWLASQEQKIRKPEHPRFFIPREFNQNLFFTKIPRFQDFKISLFQDSSKPHFYLILRTKQPQ
jgi:hypothetical protein